MLLARWSIHHPASYDVRVLQAAVCLERGDQSRAMSLLPRTMLMIQFSLALSHRNGCRVPSRSLEACRGRRPSQQYPIPTSPASSHPQISPLVYRPHRFPCRRGYRSGTTYPSYLMEVSIQLHAMLYEVALTTDHRPSCGHRHLHGRVSAPLGICLPKAVIARGLLGLHRRLFRCPTVGSGRYGQRGEGDDVSNSTYAPTRAERMWFRSMEHAVTTFTSPYAVDQEQC